MTHSSALSCMLVHDILRDIPDIWGIQYDLQQGADVNVKAADGTPLLWCLIRRDPPNSEKIINILLDAKADVEQHYKGDSILLHMAKHNIMFGVSRIITMGASLLDTDEQGDSALHVLIKKQINPEFVQTLVEAEPAITLVRDKQGYRPLDFYSKRNDGLPLSRTGVIIHDGNSRARIHIFARLSTVVPVSVLVSLIYDFL